MIGFIDQVAGFKLNLLLSKRRVWMECALDGESIGKSVALKKSGKENSERTRAPQCLADWKNSILKSIFLSTMIIIEPLDRSDSIRANWLVAIGQREQLLGTKLPRTLRRKFRQYLRRRLALVAANLPTTSHCHPYSIAIPIQFQYDSKYIRHLPLVVLARANTRCKVCEWITNSHQGFWCLWKLWIINDH